MFRDATVFVVDDDEQARESVCALVQSMGLNAQAFCSAEEFLDKYTDDRPGCLVTDLRMLGMSGLELQEQLVRQRIALPIIVLTAYARTPVTVQAMKSGAITVLEKPYDADDLWQAIVAGLAKGKSEQSIHESRQAIRSRFGQLSDSERKVLEMMLLGLPNKAIARQMDVSLRTIENRRHEIFRKMQANSVVDLVYLTREAEAGDH